MTYETFEQIRADRRAYVDISRRNKFEDGLRTLLAELYPDNAHFIYELLQNAEDARATTVEFDLSRSGLAVTHDGSRTFTLTDVEAITGIGRSPKKDDETQIGKFGVGFKAVYAYTNHPEIHSGQYAFLIEDLFVPEPVLAAPPGDKTIFTFPFDRKEKRPAVACKEVARGLRELDETTVLFLSSIRTIRYRLPDGTAGEISRSGGKAQYISIQHTTGGATEESYWLRLTGNRSVSPQIPRSQTVAAAFKLDRPLSRRGRARGADRAHVVPIDAARTCIYFPAARESSGLRFHIHAPFASTVARDSVRDTAENDALVDAIGRVIAGALPGLRDDGLIDDGLLASLPSAADPLDEPYASIREHIRGAFRNEEITPVYSAASSSHASFAPVTSLVASPPEFRVGLETRDLEVLLPLAGLDAGASPRWVAPREGRAGRFLNGLGIRPFDWDELAAVLEAVDRAEDLVFDDNGRTRMVERAEHAAWVRWLTSKDDEHLRAFYELLGLGVLEGNLPRYLQDLTLIRVHTKAGPAHLRGTGVFFPASRQELGDGNRVPLTLAYFEDDKPSKSKNQLEAFYEAAGVRHWNERSQVEVRLEAYDNLQKIKEAQHLDDMRLFIAHLAEHPADAAIFSGKSFLQRRSGKKTQQVWGKPSVTCLDKPYLNTGLAVLAAETGKLPLSNLYQRRGLPGVEDFALAVGCASKLQIRKADVWDNPQRKSEWYVDGTRPTAQGVKEDWDLPELDVILKAKNRDLLRLLWELLSQAGRDYGDATFQLNGQAQKHVIHSRLFQRLDDTAWVLHRSGRLKKPRAMTIEMLPDGWAPPADGTLVMRLGFGEVARTRGADELAARRTLAKLGMPREMIDDLLASSKEDRHEFFAEAYRKQQLRREFPSAGSADPERRAGLVGADARNAPEYETDIRERRVVKGATETREVARQYLREQYTAQSGEMYCQACHEQMPFKVGGRWYFEAVQFLPKLRKQHHQNYLALCPLCAAKYTYVRDTDDTALLAELHELEVSAGAGNASIAISLNGDRVELKFTAKHAIDLKATLTTSRTGRPDAVPSKTPLHASFRRSRAGVSWRAADYPG